MKSFNHNILIFALYFSSISLSAQKISIDSEENINLLLPIENTLLLESGDKIYSPSQNGIYEHWILMQLNKRGELNWYKEIEASITYIDIATDSDDNTLVLFEYPYEIKIGDTLLNGQGGNLFLLKFSSFGDLKWVTQATGTTYHYDMKLCLDKHNNAYFTGHVNNSLSFSNKAQIEETSAYVAKIDSDGVIVWLNSITGDPRVVQDISVNENGSCFITGEFMNDTFWGEESLKGDGRYNVFVANIDSLGNPSTLKALRSPTRAMGKEIATTDGGFILAGTFQDTLYISDSVMMTEDTPNPYSGDYFLVSFDDMMDSLFWYSSIPEIYTPILIDVNNHGQFVFYGNPYGAGYWSDMRLFFFNETGEIQCTREISTRPFSLDVAFSGTTMYTVGTNLLKQHFIEKHQNNCNSDWTYQINGYRTGTKSHNTQSRYSVFPIPTNDLLHISSENQGLISIRIMDISGRLILENSFSSNTTISLANFPSGVYLLELLDSKYCEIRKIIRD